MTKLILFLVFPFIASANSLELKINAATRTASNNAQCTSISPFYWEIGDSSRVLVSGSVGNMDGSKSIPIASASKLIFATYAIEKQNGLPSPAVVKGFNLTSGYTGFSSCIGTLLVGGCYLKRVDFNKNHEGKFYYSGGHMQKIASEDLGLAKMGNKVLKNELEKYLGTEVSLAFAFPQLAGGIVLSGKDYGLILKKIINGDYKMKVFLGTNSICTNPKNCLTAIETPVPESESWDYSFGHWVENDGTFSSPGLFGFYPWINSSKNLYGIIARHSTSKSAYWDSVKCGRLIRKAYMTGAEQ